MGAEIERCYRLGVNQCLKLQNAGGLDDKESRIQDLHIAQMQASRPEDVHEILSEIPDVQEFDRHLNHLIFNTRDGLLQAWRRVDGRGIIRRVGILVREAHMSHTKSSSKAIFDAEDPC